MTITRFNPFGELSDPTSRFFDQMSRLLSEPASSRPWAPPVDIFENENDLVLKADIPEVNLKDVDISLENGTLTLKGERKFERKEEKGDLGYHRIERNYGSFVRAFTLPDTVDPDKVKAEYANGVLTITLGKKEVAKPRSIKVQVSNN